MTFMSNIKYIENNTRALGDMEFLFECSTRYFTSEISNVTRREISNLQATMYYFGFYINILLTRKSRLKFYKESALPYIHGAK